MAQEIEMRLDMNAYVASGPGQEATALELAYWRKHPNLHGWMEQLAESKNLEYGSFNGVELELTWTIFRDNLVEARHKYPHDRH
jgi:hypothetical protein